MEPKVQIIQIWIQLHQKKIHVAEKRKGGGKNTTRTSTTMQSQRRELVLTSMSCSQDFQVLVEWSHSTYCRVHCCNQVIDQR